MAWKSTAWPYAISSPVCWPSRGSAAPRIRLSPSPHRHAARYPLETFFEPPALNERERQGLIKAFEYCFVLGWTTLRDLLLTEGNAGLIGSRDTLRLAFRMGLIDDGEAWLAMVQDRNLTSHTYNRSTAAAEEGDG